MARPQNLEEEVNSPMNDDGDLPFSEPPAAEKDDHSEDEIEVEEPGPDSRDVVREPLRLPQRRLTSKQPPPSAEQEEGMESKSKRARVNVSELLHDAFLAKAVRSKEKQRHGLNGREKLLFLGAVSKPWNAWQENAAATVIPAEAKVIWRTLRKQGLQDRVMPSRFVLVDKNDGRITAENPLDTKASARIVAPRYADPDVSPACREANGVLLAINASKGREKWTLLTADVQAAFLTAEFQDKDRVLYCWPPKNGPGLPGVQTGSLLLVVGERSPRYSFKSGLKSNECASAFSRYTLLQAC